MEHLERNGAIQTCPFDTAICPGATLSDLSRRKVADFLSRAKVERGYPLGPRTSTRAALTHLNLLDGEHPTHASVLLFADDPQRYLPTSLVKCLHFHGTEIQKPIPSYQVYKGTVFKMVDQAVDFVMSKISRTVGTREHGPQAPVTYELPPQAVTEAIVNAVCHRDYASNASVQVMLFADRLEVWNPGELPPSLSFQSLREPHPSIPRNPLLAEPLFLTRYIERAGTGTLDMARLCAAADLPAPEFRQAHGQFIQILRRPPAPATTEVTTEVTMEVTTEVGRVLEAIRGEVSRRDLQIALGLKNDEHFRKAYLLPALETDYIEMTLPEKPNSRLQKYRLTKKGRAWLAGRRK